MAGLNAYEDSDQYVAPPEPPAHLADPDAKGQAPLAANETGADDGGTGSKDGGNSHSRSSGSSSGDGSGSGGRRALLAGDADAEGTSVTTSGSLSVLGGALDTVRSWTPEARRQAAAAQEEVTTWSSTALL